MFNRSTLRAPLPVVACLLLGLVGGLVFYHPTPQERESFPERAAQIPLANSAASLPHSDAGQAMVAKYVQAVFTAKGASGELPGVPRTLTEFEKLAVRHYSIWQARSQFNNAMAQKVGKHCQGKNDFPRRLRIHYDARFEGRRAVFSFSQMEVEAGAPLSPEMDRCISEALSQEFAFQATLADEFPTFDGPGSTTLSMGVEPSIHGTRDQ